MLETPEHSCDWRKAKERDNRPLHLDFSCENRASDGDDDLNDPERDVKEESLERREVEVFHDHGAERGNPSARDSTFIRPQDNERSWCSYEMVNISANQR